MKKCLLLFLLLYPLISGAQSFIQVGPAAYPMGAWGGEVVGDFHVANLASKLSFGVGAMAFGNLSETHDEPDPGKQVGCVYVAPQVGLHYLISSKFDLYLRGGAGLLAEKKEDNEMNKKFMYNGVLGAGLSIWPHVGIYAEGGLPFSSAGLRFRF